MSSTILLILGSDEVAGGGGVADVEAVGAAVANERAKLDDEPTGLDIHCLWSSSKEHNRWQQKTKSRSERITAVIGQTRLTQREAVTASSGQ